MSAPEKPSYVYRVYDADNCLLYVGCSVNPERRMKDHRRDRRLWIPYVSHVEVVGPFPRRQALDIETHAFDNEGAHFNVTTAEKASVMDRWHTATGMAFDQGYTKWHDCPILGRTGCGVFIDEFYEARRRIEDELAATTHPVETEASRLERYLTACRRASPIPAALASHAPRQAGAA